MDDAGTAMTHPLHRLSQDDLNMVLTFVLHSGSVKALADSYSVSYPTMRNRLDALINRLKSLTAGNAPDPVTDYLANLIDKGRINPADAQKIRELHRNALAHPHQKNQTAVDRS